MRLRGAPQFPQQVDLHKSGIQNEENVFTMGNGVSGLVLALTVVRSLAADFVFSAEFTESF